MTDEEREQIEERLEQKREELADAEQRLEACAGGDFAWDIRNEIARLVEEIEGLELRRRGY